MPQPTQAPGVRRILAFGCAFTLWIAPAAFSQSTCVTQSPRRLENWNTENGPATIQKGVTEDTLLYTSPNGSKLLHRCGQHYHCEIENLQPLCTGQQATEFDRPPGSCPAHANLPVGQWVEIHTAFAAAVGTNCDPETLDCCKTGPFVVMGHHAKVIADTTPGTIPVVWGAPAAEWSGSNTSPDECPRECKPIAAKWRFNIGCDLTVSRGQLIESFHHAQGDRARGLQPAERLSSDLNRAAY